MWKAGGENETECKCAVTSAGGAKVLVLCFLCALRETEMCYCVY